MKLVITGKQIKIEPAVKKHIEERAERIAKYGFKAPQVTFTLKTQKYRQTAEAHVNLDGFVIQAEEETDDMMVSVDKAMAKIERQLKKYKETLSSHRVRTTVAEVIEAEEIAPPKKKKADLIPEIVVMEMMTIDAALLEMKENKESIFLFRNRSNRTVQILYKKKNGTIGLIEPIDK